MLCSLIVIWHITTNHPQSPQLPLNRPSFTSFFRPYIVVARPLSRLLPVIAPYIYHILAHIRSLHRPMSVSHVSTESGPFVRKTSYKSFITVDQHTRNLPGASRLSPLLGMDIPIWDVIVHHHPRSMKMTLDIGGAGPFYSIHCNTAVVYSPIYRSTRRIDVEEQTREDETRREMKREDQRSKIDQEQATTNRGIVRHHHSYVEQRREAD